MKDQIKCPECGHIDEVEKFYFFLPDAAGHPTVEAAECPACFCGTSHPDYTPRNAKGQFASFRVVAFDDFILVEQ